MPTKVPVPSREATPKSCRTVVLGQAAIPKSERRGPGTSHTHSTNRGAVAVGGPLMYVASVSMRVIGSEGPTLRMVIDIITLRYKGNRAELRPVGFVYDNKIIVARRNLHVDHFANKVRLRSFAKVVGNLKKRVGCCRLWRAVRNHASPKTLLSCARQHHVDGKTHAVLCCCESASHAHQRCAFRVVPAVKHGVGQNHSTTNEILHSLTVLNPPKMTMPNGARPCPAR